MLYVRAARYHRGGRAEGAGVVLCHAYFLIFRDLTGVFFLLFFFFRDVLSLFVGT